MPSIASLPSTGDELPPRAHSGSFPVRLLCRVSCLQLVAFILAVMGCITTICATCDSHDWRVWHVEVITDSTQQGVVRIGIWGACSIQKTAMYMKCIPFNEEESLPADIILAQDFMPLASVASALTLLWMAFALFNIFEPGKPDNFIASFFSMGAMMNLAVGTGLLISVLWNLHSVFKNELIQLPEVLGVSPAPVEQHAGLSIYIGFVAAASQLLSGTLVLGEKHFWKMMQTNTSKQKKFSDPENVTETGNPKLRMNYRPYYYSVKLEFEEENPPIRHRYESHIKMETMPGSQGIWLRNGASPMTGFF